MHWLRTEVCKAFIFISISCWSLTTLHWHIVDNANNVLTRTNEQFKYWRNTHLLMSKGGNVNNNYLNFNVFILRCCSEVKNNWSIFRFSPSFLDTFLDRTFVLSKIENDGTSWWFPIHFFRYTPISPCRQLHHVIVCWIDYATLLIWMHTKRLLYHSYTFLIVHSNQFRCLCLLWLSAVVI